MEESNANPPDRFPQASSLFNRIANIFAAPGEVYDQVKASPFSTANWLVPSLILIAVSWIGVEIIFSQPSIRQQIKDQQNLAIQKQVEKGKITKAQAEQILARTERIANAAVVIGAFIAPALAALVTPFWWGLLLWVAGAKVLKSSFSYMKAVEVAGLAGMIGVLDSIARTLLIVATGNLFVNLGPVMLVKEFDQANATHAILAVFNLITLWGLAVKSVGLSRLSGVPLGKASIFVFGMWVAYTGFLISLGMAAQSMSAG